MSTLTTFIQLSFGSSVQIHQAIKRKSRYPNLKGRGKIDTICRLKSESVSHSVVSDSLQPQGLQPARLLEMSLSASVLEMNIQGWFPLGLIGLISLLPKGLSMQLWHPRTTIQKNQLFLASSITWLSRLERTTGKNIALTIWTFVSKVMSLFNTLSRFVTEEQAS